MLISGIVDISKDEHEDPQLNYTKKLRSLLGSFMREFEHTKKLQQETAAFTTSGAARSLFTQTFPAQANAAGLARQGQALCDSTNAQDHRYYLPGTVLCGRRSWPSGCCQHPGAIQCDRRSPVKRRG